MEDEIQIIINKVIDNIVEIAKSSALEDIEIDTDDYDAIKISIDAPMLNVFINKQTQTIDIVLQFGAADLYENPHPSERYEYIIYEEQYIVVRKIFNLYLQGQSLGQIKAYLEAQGIKTVTGKDIWDTKTIQRMLTNEKYKGDTMLQKTFTEDFMTGKKRKNDGQRNKYYVKDSHPAIVSDEVFDKVQEEMTKRSRLVSKEDGTIETSGNKYNGKYLLGNWLICGDCGTSYRRRTERGKVVWRCATRIEKGKELCSHCPTLDEGWLQDTLSEAICQGGAYDEDVVKNRVDRILVFCKNIEIYCKGESKFNVDFYKR